MSKVWGSNVKHGGYNWHDYIVWLKHAKRLELKFSHQKKKKKKSKEKNIKSLTAYAK